MSSFDVAADDYDRFMGRYSRILTPRFADFAGVVHGQCALDVGCGPGALTGELVERVGARSVCAVDPSPSFVDAVHERLAGVDAREGTAEHLPFDDDSFDVALAQLVVHFMSDPVAGLGEMRRVTCEGGVVAACVWDYAGERAPLSLFWSAARELDPGVTDESRLAGAREGHLAELFELAGLRRVEVRELMVEREHPSFSEWWAPYEAGVGPAGAYVAALDPDRRSRLRDRCARLLPRPPFTVTSVAWAARARV